MGEGKKVVQVELTEGQVERLRHLLPDVELSEAIRRIALQWLGGQELGAYQKELEEKQKKEKEQLLAEKASQLNRDLDL